MKRGGKRMKKIGFLALICLFSFSLSLAQISSTGKIFGTVTDENGNPLPGVSVEATSPRLIGKATAVTDASGIYRLMALPPGEYKITFTLQGFKPVVRENIVLHVDESLKVDITMQMGPIQEEIVVTGQAPLIDVRSTTKGMTLTKQMFEVLPRGRNFDTLVTAVPGVNNEPWLGGISVDGASGAENMFYIDGTDITEVDRGRRAQSAAFEFVEEIKIVASGYPAEYGGALGGVVSVVTRQGGNEYHGEIIGYYEGSRLTGKERDTLRLNPDDYRIAEYVNYQDMYGKDKIDRFEGGFSLGGYIVKDRLWFYASALPVYRPVVRHVKFLTGGVEGDYKQKNYAYNYQAKITAQPAKFMRMGFSFVNNFSKYRGNLPARDGTSSPTDVYEKYGFDYPNYSFSAFADLTFGNNVMINLKGGRFFYNVTNQQVRPDSPRQWHGGYGIGIYLPTTDPRYRPRGWQNHPRIYVTEREIKYKNHVGADFTYYADLYGEHAFKFGVQWVRQGEDEWSALDMNYPDVYFYWGRPVIVGGINYGMGTYGYYEVRGSKVTGPFGGVWKVHNDRWAIYGQDSWTIANKFTLNVGLRAESEYIPPYTEELPPDVPKGFKPMEFDFNEKLAPRLGFIYDVFGDASLKIFGSYGLYYDVIKTYSAAHAYAGFKWKSAYYTLDTLDWDKIGVNGYFPGTLLLIYDWRYPSFDTTDPNMKPVSQSELSFGAEKMLMENLSATVRFVYKHLRYTIEDVGVIVPGVGEVYFETNPGYGYSITGTPEFPLDPRYPKCPRAKRDYYGLNFALDKRLANNWLAGFSYTWSRLWGNYSGLASSDEYGRTSPYVERSFDNWAMNVTKDLTYQEGPLPTDRPHFIKFYGAYSFPFGLTIGSVLNAMSGTPVTETWSILSAYFFPFNRGYVREGGDPDTGVGGKIVRKRTPFLWYMNAYAEYNLKIGKYRLNINLNVDNVFNVKTATRLYDYRTYAQLNVSEEMVLSKNWDLNTPGVGFVKDARFLKKMDFYPPIAARLGIKFIF